MSLSLNYVTQLSQSQELIRQFATYADYVDKRFLPSTFNYPENFDGFLIIDEETMSIYQKNEGNIQFKFIKNTLREIN